MPNVFISYRRDDSQAISDRIYERLARSLGERSVFKDVDDIPFGRDFRAVLHERVVESDVLLVLIGRAWADAAYDDGSLRLMDDDDFVRIEIESGLKDSEMLVVPVLVNGATMPTPELLPESLRPLVYRNAIQVRNDPDFKNDIERLIQYLRRLDGQSRSVPLTRTAGSSVLRGGWMAFGVLTVLLVMAGLFLSGAFDGDDGATGEPTSAAMVGPTVTLTRTSPPTDEPTPTPTPTGTPTAIPTPTPTPRPVQMNEITLTNDLPADAPDAQISPEAETVRLQRLPDDDEVVATVPGGANVKLVGVDSLEDWAYIGHRDEERTAYGWVSTSFVLPSVPLSQVTVISTTIAGSVFDNQPVTLDVVDPFDFSGELSGMGSEWAYPYIETVSQRFIEEGFAGDLVYSIIGSGAGFERFCNEPGYGFTTASRAVRDSEVEVCSTNNAYTVTGFPFGWFAPVIAISPENDWVMDINAEEAMQILATAEMWSDVNAGWPAEPIIRYLPDTDSILFDIMLTTYLEDDEQIINEASDVQYSMNDDVLLEAVQTTPYTVSVFNYLFVSAQGYESLLAFDGVYPDRTTITAGDYAPAVPLYIYTAPEAIADMPQIAAFINYLLRLSDDDYAEMGLVVPDDETDEANAARWFNLVADAGLDLP